MCLLLLLTAVPAAIPVSLAQDSAGQSRKERAKDESKDKAKDESKDKAKDERVFYKGQIHVSRVAVYQEQGKVRLTMRVTFSTDLLNRGEKLYVSPQLRRDNERTTFAPMVFDGKSRKWRVRNGNVIVVADEAYGNYHFDIDYVATYQEWMQGGALAFLSEEIVGSGVRNHFTDVVFDNLRIVPRQDGEKIQPLVAAAAAEAATRPAAIALQDSLQERDRQLEELVRSRNADQQAAALSERGDNGVVLAPVIEDSKSAKADARFFFRTNLLYDAVLLPNVGIELGVSPKVSLVLNAGGNWLKNDTKHWYWRMLSADLEGRYWLGQRPAYEGFQHKGHHIGVYGAVYRYDIEFGHKGQMGDFAYGGGVSYGYSVPIGRRLSLDLALALGYIGGKYKEYEPQDDCYVWLADKRRHYFGPTKAEVTLVWHLGN